jgi:hypothetical protein
LETPTQLQWVGKAIEPKPIQLVVIIVIEIKTAHDVSKVTFKSVFTSAVH